MEAVTLTEFLLARIADDEAVAREASSPSLRAWEVRGLDIYTVAGPPSFNPIARHALGQQGEHIARWDPARVLAECAAKRRIIDHHHIEWAGSRGGGWFCWVCGGPDADIYERNPTETQACPDLAALASVYTSHADFDPEWRV